MSCFGGARTWDSSPTAAKAIGSFSGHCSGSYGCGIAKSSYGSVGCGYTRKNNGYRVGVAPYGSSIWGYARECSEVNDSLGSRDLRSKSGTPKSRGSLPIGYGFGSTFTDVVSYSESHEIAGKKTNIGEAIKQFYRVFLTHSVYSYH